MPNQSLLSRLRHICGALTLLTLVTLAAPAWGASPTEAQLELNDSAVENIIEGKYARAVAQLEEAVLLGEFNILYLNLGRAYQKLGNCEKARQALQKAKKAPALEQPPAKLVNTKVDQYMAELDESCEAGAGSGAQKAEGEGGGGTSQGSNGQADAVAVEDDPGLKFPPMPTVRERHPNLLYLEVGGHGGVSTLNYERFFLFGYDMGVELDLGMGVGVGHTSGEINYGVWKANGRLSSLPIYLTGTFFGDVHSMHLQGGVTLLSAKLTPVDDNTSGAVAVASGAYPFVQVGYQLHVRTGFLLRASITGSKYTGVAPGLTLGWSF